ncbi:unnamed protein product [Urochloa humidicola]
MSREGVHANYMREREQPEEEEVEEAVVVVADGQQRFFDAGRVLMLWGWVALAAVSTGHAFLGLVLWLLGVSFIAIVPVARRRFPRAARAGGAVANAVVDCFFPPFNN